MRLSARLLSGLSLPCALGLLAGCGAAGPVVILENQPMSEKVLAARKLQRPLTAHLCQAAVYPTADRGFQVSRVQTLAGRGPTFTEALEALCREADGLRLPAVVDIYYFRAPDAWSGVHEVRGTGVRYEAGWTPPPPPSFADIKAPAFPARAASEPAPSGEGK